MKTNNADLYFYEELKREIGREQSLEWLRSETKFLNTPESLNQFSPTRSPCDSPRTNAPSTPRGLVAEPIDSN